MTPRQLLDLVRVDVCVCMFEWVCVCVRTCSMRSWCARVCEYVHSLDRRALWVCHTHLKLIGQTHWPLVLKEKIRRTHFHIQEFSCDTDLRFDCAGLTGASRWLASEVLLKSGMGQDVGHLSINLHHFIGLWNTHTSDIVCIQCISWRLSFSFITGSTDLECVLRVKLEAALYSCNAPVIYDLTGLGVAFRDLEQAVCGRDKLEVAWIARTGKTESINASVNNNL